jgi:hypothetical protein
MRNVRNTRAILGRPCGTASLRQYRWVIRRKGPTNHPPHILHQHAVGVPTPSNVIAWGACRAPCAIRTFGEGLVLQTQRDALEALWEQRVHLRACGGVVHRVQLAVEVQHPLEVCYWVLRVDISTRSGGMEEIAPRMGC